MIYPAFLRFVYMATYWIICVIQFCKQVDLLHVVLTSSYVPSVSIVLHYSSKDTAAVLVKRGTVRVAKQ